eukprot:GHVS01045613.1.p1 GENE.GHVS01045613.1~~GHVS01045613.1.p1  ORF type:complete len:102 (+),score=6.07 GHVS01045613.1:161-466(+)
MKRSFKKQLWNPQFDMSSFFKTDPDIKAMRKHIPPGFCREFRRGFQSYTRGEWDDARRMLQGVKTQLGHEDGPTMVLLRYMEEFDYVAPQEWRGFRSLTEK